jgi:YesN/AraC family two-component response regulator
MDVKMPGLDGPETLIIMREINPAVCCCFMSGYPGKFTEKGLSEMGTVFLWKPFGLDQVADSLRRLRKIFCQ